MVPLSLEGKVALITRGSRGIGAAAVRLFHQAGARIAFNYRSARARILAAIPQGRVARPIEIAGPILFLCTPYTAFVSGEILNINGGAVLAG